MTGQGHLSGPSAAASSSNEKGETVEHYSVPEGIEGADEKFWKPIPVSANHGEPPATDDWEESFKKWKKEHSATYGVYPPVADWQARFREWREKVAQKPMIPEGMEGIEGADEEFWKPVVPPSKTEEKPKAPETMRPGKARIGEIYSSVDTIVTIVGTVIMFVAWVYAISVSVSSQSTKPEPPSCSKLLDNGDINFDCHVEFVKYYEAMKTNAAPQNDTSWIGHALGLVFGPIAVVVGSVVFFALEMLFVILNVFMKILVPLCQLTVTIFNVVLFFVRLAIPFALFIAARRFYNSQFLADKIAHLKQTLTQKTHIVGEIAQTWINKCQSFATVRPPPRSTPASSSPTSDPLSPAEEPRMFVVKGSSGEIFNFIPRELQDGETAVVYDLVVSQTSPLKMQK